MENDEKFAPLAKTMEDNTTDISQKILESDDLVEIKNLTKLFNLNQNKSEVLRIMKLNEMLDKTNDELLSRLTNFSGAFTNQELTKLVDTLQNSIDRASSNLNLIDQAPQINPIVQKNTQVNVQINEMDRYSRERVYAALQNLLGNQQTTEIIDVDNEENT